MCFSLFLFFGDMTLVTYRRKSFSMREDDSCAPHSPHTMSIQQVRPFGLGGFGVSSFSQFNLEQFREEFYLFFKKKKKKKKKESLEGSRFHRQKNPPYSNPNLCIVV